MRTRSILTLTILSLVSLFSIQAMQAQSFAATSDANTRTTAWHDTEVPSDKQISADVKDGVLVIDGLVVKVQLNYEIHHAGYLYFFVPGVGTAIVSRVAMQDAVKVKDAFRGSALTFQAGGHSFELTSDTNLVSGKEDAYVRLDTATLGIDPFPMMGYGSTTRAPYVWPFSKEEPKSPTADSQWAPPLPKSVLPRTHAADAPSLATARVATPSAASATAAGSNQ